MTGHQIRLADGPLRDTMTGSAPERWRSDGASADARLQSWSEILAATHLRFDVRPTHRTPARFQAAVTRRSLAGLALVDCAASPFLGRRPETVIGSHAENGPEDILGFQVVVRGAEIVREGTRTLKLTAGDVVLWNGLQPTEIEIAEPFCKRTLLFPRDRVLSVCPRLGTLDAIPPLEANASARLLVRYMNALAPEIPRLDAVAATAAAAAALELLRAAVEPALPSDRAAVRAAMRTEIGRYVRGHLQDPTLAPATIARAYAISVRTLYAVFEDVDQSVAGLIRTERLARCAQDLRQPNGGSVTEIAFRWGFCDAAHFSRVFKRKYGVSPRDVRQGALADAHPRSYQA